MKNRFFIIPALAMAIVTLLALEGCNKSPYMPDGDPVYIGTTDNEYGLDNDTENVLQDIRIMTYNIHAGIPPTRDDTVDMKGIVTGIRLGNPDIVFLQEVDKETGRAGFFIDQSQALADSLKMNFAYFSARTYLRGFYGISILSKYPLYSIRKYLLPKENENTEQRVLGTALVDLPGKDSVLLAVTHLQHNSSTNRIQQIKEIKSLLNERKEKIIFGGDLNEVETQNSEFYSIFDSFLTRTCEGDGCPLTFSSIRPSSTIDFISYKPANAFQAVSTNAIQTYGSDHFPVVSVLKFNR